MINQSKSSEVLVNEQPNTTHDDWFIRIQRAKKAREQGQKAREGKPITNPIANTLLPLNRN